MEPANRGIFEKLAIIAVLGAFGLGVGCSTLIGLEDVPPATGQESAGKDADSATAETGGTDTPIERQPVDAAAEAPRDSSADGAANGSICTLAGDCASGNCIDGVCCNTQCADRCTSCLAANTGG